MKISTLAGLALLAGLAPSAFATEPFRPWLQAHWEVAESNGLPTPAMKSGVFRPWLQAHWEVAESNGLPTPAMKSGVFRPWLQAHWEVADDPMGTVPTPSAAGELADR